MPAKLTLTEFIHRANQTHNFKYDYSEFEYKGSPIKGKIICPEHGPFMQSPNSHLAGHGCPQCSAGTTGAQPAQKTQGQFLAQLKSVFGDRYGTEKVLYVNAKTKVQLTCPDHGPFMSAPQHLLAGHGCPACGRERTIFSRQKTTEDFVRDAREVHGDTYDYAETEYVSARGKVAIRCQKHGLFQQEADKHLAGQGCPKCGHRISAAEIEVANFLRSLDVAVEPDFYIGRNQFDIKAGNVLVEYHGLYFHSTAVLANDKARSKHLDKRKMAEANGFRYIAIYEDEWRDRRQVVQDFLRAVFGKAPRAGARDFTVSEVAPAAARAFYDQHHLLGAGAAAGRHMALVDANGRVAACMTIGPSSEQRGAHATCLSRFATDGRSIAGAATRLLHSFGPLPELVSYVDLDKFTGGVYARLEFELDHEIAPDYWTLWHKSGAGLVRRHKTATKLDNLRKIPGFDPTKTEFENCQEMGLYRIYHSGRLCVVRPAKTE